MLQKVLAVLFILHRIDRQNTLHHSPVNEPRPHLTKHLLDQAGLPHLERNPAINQGESSAAEIVGELLRQQFIRIPQGSRNPMQ